MMDRTNEFPYRNAFPHLLGKDHPCDQHKYDRDTKSLSMSVGSIVYAAYDTNLISLTFVSRI